MVTAVQDDYEKEEIEMGTKGNKKGQPILWSLVKNTSLFITLCVFLLTSVLVLDAYKFVSVRVSYRNVISLNNYDDPCLTAHD